MDLFSFIISGRSKTIFLLLKLPRKKNSFDKLNVSSIIRGSLVKNFLFHSSTIEKWFKSGKSNYFKFSLMLWYYVILKKFLKN